MKLKRIFLLLSLPSLLFGAWLTAPRLALAQDRVPTYSKTIWDSAFQGANAIRYGNWYGPGWWGGSLDAKRVGIMPPIDSLDAVAQKHDFGYKVAEELGKGRPAIIAHYMAIADAIAVRDAANLPKDPADWPHPPTDVKLARDLRDRIVVGFRDVWQHVNEAKGLLKKRYDLTDEEEMDGLLGLEQLESRQNAELAAWNKQYKQWQATKAARARAKAPTPKPVAPAPKPIKPPVVSLPTGSTRKGRWVLTELGKVDRLENPGSVKKAEFGNERFRAVMTTPSGQENIFVASWSTPPSELVPEVPITLSLSIQGNWGRLEVSGRSGIPLVQLRGMDPEPSRPRSVQMTPRAGGPGFEICFHAYAGVAFVWQSRTFSYTWPR